MADVVITLKLAASEFQILREELRAHSASLRVGAKSAKEAQNYSDERELLKRQAKVESILERLG